MLTREHAIADYNRGQIIPDRLIKGPHSHYLPYAQRMLEVYREGAGRTRHELHQDIHKIFREEPDCPSRRIEAFCKLLDDVSVYDRDIGGKAANLRKKVFRFSAGFHPLVQEVDRFFEHSEADIKAKIAADMGKPWPVIERDLFADITEYHRLREFSGYPGPRELLSRYNVAQVQAALYRAVEMIVWTGDDFKTILRYAKLARLMHTIHRTDEGRYRVHFDGPASVLRNTRRYGVHMAKFFPALVACRDWSMHARIATARKGFMLSLQLSHRDHLKSHFPPLEEFDSSIEENFAEKWGSEKREGWSLIREGEILYKGQKVFFPDFVLQHDDGRKVYLEIIGFWTPQYLKAKIETLTTFQEHNILIAVLESVEEGKGMEGADSIPGFYEKAIRFKSSLHLKDVLACLEKL
jgi:predicted nuclease of restriction endonuclease-like RecB superfamily